jgi:hypothetical protein
LIYKISDFKNQIYILKKTLEHGKCTKLGRSEKINSLEALWEESKTLEIEEQCQLKVSKLIFKTIEFYIKSRYYYVYIQSKIKKMTEYLELKKREMILVEKKRKKEKKIDKKLLQCVTNYIENCIKYSKSMKHK